MSNCPHMLSVEHHVWAEAREAEGRKQLAGRESYQFAATRRLARELATGERSPTTVEIVALGASAALAPASHSPLRGTRRALDAPPTVTVADPYGVWATGEFDARRSQLADERAAALRTFNAGGELRALERYTAIVASAPDTDAPFARNYYPVQGYESKPTLW